MLLHAPRSLPSSAAVVVRCDWTGTQKSIWQGRAFATLSVLFYLAKFVRLRASLGDKTFRYGGEWICDAVSIMGVSTVVTVPNVFDKTCPT